MSDLVNLYPRPFALPKVVNVDVHAALRVFPPLCDYTTTSRRDLLFSSQQHPYPNLKPESSSNPTNWEPVPPTREDDSLNRNMEVLPLTPMTPLCREETSSSYLSEDPSFGARLPLPSPSFSDNMDVDLESTDGTLLLPLRAKQTLCEHSDPEIKGPVIIPSEAFHFWSQLSELVYRLQLMHGSVTVQTDARDSMKNQFHAWNLRHPPREEDLLAWITRGRVTEIPTLALNHEMNYLPLYHMGGATGARGPWSGNELEKKPVVPFNFSAHFQLDDNFLDLHPSMEDLPMLQRYYCLVCITEHIRCEASQEDPVLDSWMFQFTCQLMLSGSSWISQQAETLLRRLPPRQWMDRYVFCGGLVRQSLTRHMQDLSRDAQSTLSNELAASIQDKTCRLVKVFRLIFQIVSGYDSVSDWMAFFEQYDNKLNFVEAFRSMVPVIQRWSPSFQDQWSQALSDLERLSEEDFRRKRVSRGIFQAVDKVDATHVFLRYKNCPRTVKVKKTSIQDDRILQQLKTFLDFSPSSSQLHVPGVVL